MADLRSSSEILAEVEAVYREGQRQWRSSILQAGQLLHDYILSGLREGGQLPEKQRLKVGITRGKLIKEAAIRLGVARHRVVYLIGVSQVSVLFFDGNPPENFTPTALKALIPFVVRNKGGDGRITHPGRPGGPPLEILETWKIRPELKAAALQMIESATREEWREPLIRRAAREISCKPYRRGKEKGERRTQPTGTGTESKPEPQSSTQRRTQASSSRRAREEELAAPKVDQLKSLAKAAGPRDMAEVLAEIVLESSDPKALLEHLSRAVARKQKEQSPYFAEVG